jgi:hypothetical protein
MSKEKRNEWILGLSLIGIMFIFFCIYTSIDFPIITQPTATPWPTLDARTVDLHDSLLKADDFGRDSKVRLGKQYDRLPGQEFTSELDFRSQNIHVFKDYGKPIRIYTYELLDRREDVYWPRGYLAVFIYENANEAKTIYGSGQELPYFDLARFVDGYPNDWAHGSFLRCRIIGEIYVERFSKDNVTFLSRDISSRMGYLC